MYKGRLSILIVDDRQQNISAVAPLIIAAGYDLIAAYDGSGALNKVKEIKPDLILLDVNLPDMDGYEICKRLKSSTVTRDIPIIFLTGETNQVAIQKGFDAGGVDYISKPFNKSELMSRIQTQLSLKMHSDHLEKLVKERTAELADALKSTEKANNLKSEFLANMSHELRTPLNAIVGSSDIIKGHVETDYLSHLDEIHSSSFQLLSMIDRVILLAKYESNNIDLHRSTGNMLDICKFIEAQFVSKLQQKNIQLIIDCTCENDLLIDHQLICQILCELVDNSIQSTNNGFIKFTIRLNKPNSDSGHLEITILDNGKGLSSEFFHTAFEPFKTFRNEYCQVNHSKGAGLGLAICKKAVELMGGSISLEKHSEPGCKVFISLPDIQELIEGTDSAIKSNICPDTLEVIQKDILPLIEELETGFSIDAAQQLLQALEIPTLKPFSESLSKAVAEFDVVRINSLLSSFRTDIQKF
ncbi:MAG: hybrid sensor histidine kinase/response regulator [Lentisphaerales bacterium]|nr:hybrid sensor histidine kinase/response regulator [Lentisphaerales bacterium]